MSCIRPAIPNSRSSVPSMPSARAWRHREDRDVHHVRERVVVVALERGEGDERGAILRDGLGERVDHAARCTRVGAALRHRLLPEPFRDRRGLVVGRPDGRRIGQRRVHALLDLDAADLHVGQAGSDRDSPGVARRLSAPAKADTSVAISSAVTSRSMTMRSTPSRCSRRIRSPIVPLERGRGTSPTTNSPPTTPSVSDRCWPMTRPMVSKNAWVLRATSGWLGRVELRASNADAKRRSSSSASRTRRLWSIIRPRPLAPRGAPGGAAARQLLPGRVAHPATALLGGLGQGGGRLRGAYLPKGAAPPPTESPRSGMAPTIRHRGGPWTALRRPRVHRARQALRSPTRRPSGPSGDTRDCARCAGTAAARAHRARCPGRQGSRRAIRPTPRSVPSRAGLYASSVPMVTIARMASRWTLTSASSSSGASSGSASLPPKARNR